MSLIANRFRREDLVCIVFHLIELSLFLGTPSAPIRGWCMDSKNGMKPVQLIDRERQPVLSFSYKAFGFKMGERFGQAVECVVFHREHKTFHPTVALKSLIINSGRSSDGYRIEASA